MPERPAACCREAHEHAPDQRLHLEHLGDLDIDDAGIMLLDGTEDANGDELHYRLEFRPDGAGGAASACEPPTTEAT